MTSEQSPDLQTITSLLEQLTRRLHSQGYAGRLFPAQWAALRYVQSAPSHLRTAIDLARFQGLASGAVARTVRTLVRKGYMEKLGTIGRGRAEQLQLTDRGRTLLKSDPMQDVARALHGLDQQGRDALLHSLRLLVQATGGPLAVADQAEESEGSQLQA